MLIKGTFQLIIKMFFFLPAVAEYEKVEVDGTLTTILSTNSDVIYRDDLSPCCEPIIEELFSDLCCHVVVQEETWHSYPKRGFCS